MNTRTLNRRLNNYVKHTLRAGNEDSTVVDVIGDLQSISDDDDHSIDTADVIDSMYLPNPAIVEEMEVEINEEAEITNYDTAVKLLSDSNEALRRLDIIRMNVNYPVSGYRTNTTTLLKAEPGLEGLMGNGQFNKRQLNVAIEAIGKKLLVGLITTLIAAITGSVFAVIARMRKKKSDSISKEKVEEVKKEILSRDDEIKQKVEEYYQEEAWGKLSPPAKATAVDMTASLARFEKVGAIGKLLKAEISVITSQTNHLKAVLEKGGDYSGAVHIIKKLSFESDFYNLAGELEDEMDNLVKNNRDAEPMVMNRFMDAVYELSARDSSLNRGEFQAASKDIENFKRELDKLKSAMSNNQADEKTDGEKLFNKALRNLTARGMDLAGVYRAVDVQMTSMDSLFDTLSLLLSQTLRISQDVDAKKTRRKVNSNQR